jgi:hypothetical protein
MCWHTWPLVSPCMLDCAATVKWLRNIFCISTMNSVFTIASSFFQVPSSPNFSSAYHIRSILLIQNSKLSRFEDFMAVKNEIVILWLMTPCRQTSILKTEASHSSKTLATTSETTWSHELEDSNQWSLTERSVFCEWCWAHPVSYILPDVKKPSQSPQYLGPPLLHLWIVRRKFLFQNRETGITITKVLHHTKQWQVESVHCNCSIYVLQHLFYIQWPRILNF